MEFNMTNESNQTPLFDQQPPTAPKSIIAAGLNKFKAQPRKRQVGIVAVGLIAFSGLANAAGGAEESSAANPGNTVVTAPITSTPAPRVTVEPVRPEPSATTEPVVEEEDVTEPVAEEVEAEEAAPEEEAVAEPEPPVTSNGISPEFQAAMDSYEEFFDEYVAHMRRFNANPSDLSLLTGLTNMMTRYTDTMDKLDRLENNLSGAELDYYLTVMTRINRNLLSVL